MISTDMADSAQQFHAELTQAVGEAIGAFALIEMLTYRCMADLSSEPLHELMADQSFSARMRLSRKLVKRLKEQDELKAIVLHHFDDAEKLAQTRNIIAHNPWMVSVNLDEGSFGEAEILKVTDQTKNLDLKLVREFTDKARELGFALGRALGQLRYPGP